jgi:hypothetical protein
MTSFFQHPDPTTPVHTATKSIKLYSDNPIHDCIDRIIEACTRIDTDSEDACLAATQMMVAAHSLFDLASDKRAEIDSNNRRKFNEKFSH